MKKKIWSLVLILLVAVCGGVFAACGCTDQNPADNVSLVVSGLDSNLSAEKLANISAELSLSEHERTSLASGVGYDAKISSGNVLTLIVGSDDFSTREITVRIDGFTEGMSQSINFSSDSPNISFSKVTYLGQGYAKVVVTGLSAGTSQVTAISEQYSKKVTFTVKVLELPSSFTVKTDAVIYIEKGATITINPQDYINFYPATTNMKDVEIYNGDKLLTKDGVTTLTAKSGEENAILQSTVLTVKSTRISGGGSVKIINVKVVDNISQLGLEKAVYSETGEIVETNFQKVEDILYVIKNSSKTYNSDTEDEFSISYGIRKVYVVVQNAEENLEINTKVYINGIITPISVLQTDHAFVTKETYVAESEYGKVVADYIENQMSYSFHVFKFEFQYTGYDAYDVQFSFNVGEYKYSKTKNLSVDFKNASNLVEFKKSNETEEKTSYTVYDSYNGVAGTRFVIKTNTGNLSYSLQLLVTEDLADLEFLTTTTPIKAKTVTNNTITFTNGENFYIKGKSAGKEYDLTFKVVYTHDGIQFETTKLIKIRVQKAPNSVNFYKNTSPNSNAGNGISGYNFDLNTAGYRIGSTESYALNNTLSLYLYSYDNLDSLIDAVVGSDVEFSISTTSSIIKIEKDELVKNKINITALGTGVGKFKITLGNNVEETFTFEIVNSVSELNAVIPNENQNDNVFSLKTDYEYNGTTYHNYLIAFTGKNIPINIAKVGDVKSLSITCIDNGINYLTYTNGYLKTTQDFDSEKKVAVITVTYKYIDNNNVIQTATVIADKILLTSVTNISNFTLTTSKNTKSFNLYDYKTVGHYSKELSLANVYVNILPTALYNEFLEQIEWSSNFEHTVEDSATTYTLISKAFKFVYNKLTGIGELTCEVTDANLYDENGNFKFGEILITGEINRGDYGTYAQSIQFNVKKNIQVASITPNEDEIYLDEYSNEVSLYLNILPIMASNQKMNYLFIPDAGSGISSTAVEVEEISNNEIKLTLKDSSKAGKGKLKIIALDSYINKDTYSKSIEIVVNISDGSLESPYQIISSNDIRKMIDTNFSKYYVISNSIDVSLSNWEFSRYTLSGHITGINNAEIKGIELNLEDLYQEGSSNYIGLFKEITGSISNVKISGKINIEFNASLNNMTYIGLLAGKNNGNITNVYVELADSTIQVKNGYKLKVGGVVGENSAIINTVIKEDSTYTRMVKFLGTLNFIDATTVGGNTIYIGGVAGSNNNGIISREMDNEYIDFNNSFVSAEVYINAYYLYELKSESSEGIGGICGYSIANAVENGLFGVSSCGEITAGRYNNMGKDAGYSQTYSSSNNVFYGHFNYVGGLVGYNQATISSKNYEDVQTNPETRTYVRGKNYVGGAVGLNLGNISNLRVEAVEIEYGSGYKTGLSASLVIGEKYVGGIAGYHNAGEISSSSFISYLNRSYVVEGTTYQMITDLSKTNSDKTYFGDVVIIESDNSIMDFGLLFGKQIGTTDYVVAIGNIQFISTNSSYNNPQSCSDVISSDYAIYGNFIDQNSLITEIDIKDGLAITKTKTDLKQTDGFKFIYLPPENIGIELVDVENSKEDGVGQKMSSNDGDDLAFYLYYYATTDADILKILNNKALNETAILNYINSINLKKAVLKSSDSSILSIGTNNKFVIKGTGVVTITVTTPYNINIKQSIHICVVNYTNNISAYLSSDKVKNQIKQDDKISFSANESTMIYFNFLDQGNSYDLISPKDILVLAKVVVGGPTYIVKAGENLNTDAGFRLIKLSEDSYQFVVDNVARLEFYSISFIPYIEKIISGKTYTTYLSEENKIDLNISDKVKTPSQLILNQNVSFKYNLINVTKSINLTSNEITEQPYYETSVDVLLDSKNKSETLTIKISMLDETGAVDNSFNPNWIKMSVKYGSNVEYNGTKNSRSSTITLSDVDIPAIDGKLTLTFSYEEDFRDFRESKRFKVTVVSSNYKTGQMILIYEPQELINATTTLYDEISESDSQYGFTEGFSYIPSNTMIPGQLSLIEFNLVPYYTNFYTIEIVNASTNETDILFELYNRTNQSIVTGARNINRGISISKDLINNGKFYLRTFLSDSITDNSTLSIKIIMKDENGNVIGKEIPPKLFYVQHLPGVRLTVDGVNSGNNANDPLKLARGKTYELGVWVKGYSDGTLIKSGNTYTDGELIFVLSNDLASIVKNSDGSYNLVITSENIEQNGKRNLVITTYGMKQGKEGIEKSKEIEIHLEIDEFVVKSLTDLGNLVREVVNGVLPSAVGNLYNFEISLNNNILIYDTRNSEITAEVVKFLASLSTGVLDKDNKISVWAYQDLSKTTTTWAKVNLENTAFKSSGTSTNIFEYKTSNGVFLFKYDSSNQKFSVTFMKTEDSENPTFKFSYNASYYYKDGIPTLKTGSLLSNTAVYDLSQIFVFDVYERTDLRNPYPIYDDKGLMDMREGNYYILQNDIPLPSNFTPITTKIGGLDGNNYKIIVPNIDIIGTETNSSLKFGLFAETSTDTLLENIILYIKGSIVINTYNYSNVTYGLLVGVNYGQITNCAIEGEGFRIVYLNLIGLSSSSSIVNEVGGLVGKNYGNITNSRIEAGISVNGISIGTNSYMSANLGGIASRNMGTIASSYVKNARIENNVNVTTAETGGVVAINEIGGKIFSSYISDDSDMSSSFVKSDSLYKVYSGAHAGAFVYENWGEISNCYANVAMETNGSSSGFVYSNKKNATISYSYSTSLVVASGVNSAFVGISSQSGNVLNEGTLYECFALEDDTLGYNTGIASNKSVGDGLKITTANNFALKSTFSNYAFSQTADKADGVWFLPNSSGIESTFERNGQAMKFKTGRPELVSANIISAGKKIFTDSEYNEETGVTKYNYRDSGEEKGSKFNPYIIATTDDVEYMKENATNFVIGNDYYRIICDIIYETSSVSSGLYKYSFLGNIEGNGFTIGNYVLDSAEVLENAGFFATIGTYSNQVGSIKNLTFAPRYISLTNASAVGAVAGKAYSTTLVNITVDGFEYSSSPTGVVILGKNCVGGVFAISVGAYNFNNITANISVNSTYRANLNSHTAKLYTSGEYNKISYAGIAFGALDGNGQLIRIKVYGNNVSIAENAGLLFGYVGKNVNASILNATSSIKQYIKADIYGGIIAAHNEGTLKDITIVDDLKKVSFFVIEDYIPVALGNIVGLMTAGTIQDATKVNVNLKAQTEVKYVGGAVGLMKAGTLKNIIITGDITAGSTIGGLVGQVHNVSTTQWNVTIEDCYHNGKINSISSDSVVRTGSIIGYANVESSEIGTETTKKVSIITNALFVSETKNKIRTGIYKIKTVNVTNFAYSTNLQIWVGTVIIKPDASSGKNGELYQEYDPLTTSPENDFQKIYTISKNGGGSTIYVVRLVSYLLNGK